MFFFNRAILNILKNVILNETIVRNVRDPPLFNNKIRLFIKEKTTAYKYFYQNGDGIHWQYRLKVLQDCINKSIEFSKRKHNNRMTSKLPNIEKKFPKGTYWKVKVYTENILIYEENTTDTSVISQLLFFSYFHTKILNYSCFSLKSVFTNWLYNSELPTNFNHVTNWHLPTVTSSASDIGNFIQNLNSNKTH